MSRVWYIAHHMANETMVRHLESHTDIQVLTFDWPDFGISPHTETGIVRHFGQHYSCHFLDEII